MLLEIVLENFYSIRESITLDFRAGHIKTASAEALANNVIEWEKETILKSIGLFGPNASGKTNIIKAIHFCSRMVLESHLHNEGTLFNFSPFKFGEWAQKPSSFSINFVHEGIEYEYSYSLTRTEIMNESLYFYPKGRRAKIFTRDESIEGAKSDKYSFGDSIPKPWDVAENTSRKTLFLSRASQMDREIPKQIFRYFNERFMLGLVDLSTQYADSIFKQNKDLILHALKICDSDITDIHSISEKLDARTFKVDFASGTSSIQPEVLEQVRFQTIHRHAPNVSFDLQTEESHGTSQMFGVLLRLIDVVRNDKALMLDEFDASFHTRIAEFILDLFHASGKAQFLYTSHNTNLIDLKRARRDQIFFVNKNTDGATEVYSLFDYKDFRENMDAEKGYLQGRFDAVPIIDTSVANINKLIRG